MCLEIYELDPAHFSLHQDYHEKNKNYLVSKPNYYVTIFFLDIIPAKRKMKGIQILLSKPV